MDEAQATEEANTETAEASPTKAQAADALGGAKVLADATLVAEVPEYSLIFLKGDWLHFVLL